MNPKRGLLLGRGGLCSAGFRVACCWFSGPNLKSKPKVGTETDDLLRDNTGPHSLGSPLLFLNSRPSH